MKNLRQVKSIFHKNVIGWQVIGLGSSHRSRFLGSVTLGTNFFILFAFGLFICNILLWNYSLLCCSVKPEILKNVGKAISTFPENFKPHRGVKRVYEQRAQMIESGEGIDWGLGEALAFATLVVEGNHVRLSGQDVERGTFSHRHSVLHDQETGKEYCPLDHLTMNQDPEMFTVSNR